MRTCVMTGCGEPALAHLMTCEKHAHPRAANEPPLTKVSVQMPPCKPPKSDNPTLDAHHAVVAGFKDQIEYLRAQLAAKEALLAKSQMDHLDTLEVLAVSNTQGKEYLEAWHKVERERESMGQELAAEQKQRREAEARVAEWRILNAWGGTPEIINEFIKGQQTRIHAAQEAEQEAAELRKALESARGLISKIAPFYARMPVELRVDISFELSKMVADSPALAAKPNREAK